MNRYRKRPVEIEARQWDGTPQAADPIIDWILTAGSTARYSCNGDTCTPDAHTIAIDTLEGTMHASPGDWIIRGVQDEFYPCKPDIFTATYEPVEDPTP